MMRTDSSRGCDRLLYGGGNCLRRGSGRRLPAMARRTMAGAAAVWASPRRRSIPLSGDLNPTCRCPTSPFRVRPRRLHSSRNLCRRRRNTCARRASIALPRGVGSSPRIYRDTLARIERNRRARQRGVGDLGARNRLWRLSATERCHPRAGHAGLRRQAQGFLPQ